jgi:anti-sigma B factor antagonist
MAAPTQSAPLFHVIRRQNTAVITPASGVATALEEALQRESNSALEPLRASPPHGLVVDLSQLNYFGSLFLTFLIRCHTMTKRQGGRLVLAGVSPRAREILCLTALDTLWDTYPNAQAAVDALNAA